MLLLEVVPDGASDRHNPCKCALLAFVLVVFALHIINGNAVFQSFPLDCKPSCVGLRTERETIRDNPKNPPHVPSLGIYPRRAPDGTSTAFVA